MSYASESCAFLTANRKIVFYGCTGVIKYTDTEIILSLTDNDVSVEGKALLLSTFFGGEISVTGEIEGIFLGKNKGCKG